MGFGILGITTRALLGSLPFGRSLQRPPSSQYFHGGMPLRCSKSCDSNSAADGRRMVPPIAPAVGRWPSFGRFDRGYARSRRRGQWLPGAITNRGFAITTIQRTMYTARSLKFDETAGEVRRLVIRMPSCATQRAKNSKATKVRWPQTLTWEVRWMTFQTETDGFACGKVLLAARSPRLEAT